MRLSSLGWVLTISTAIITTLANLLIRIGIEQAGGFAFDGPIALIKNFLKLLFNPVFTIGFISYFFAALLWFRIISFERLGTAYPILVGATFLFITTSTIFFLQEPLSIRKLMGIVIIVAGITLISVEKV